MKFVLSCFDLGAVDIFQSAALNGHWTFRSELPPSTLLNVHMEFRTDYISQAATQGDADAKCNFPKPKAF